MTDYKKRVLSAEPEELKELIALQKGWTYSPIWGKEHTFKMVPPGGGLEKVVPYWPDSIGKAWELWKELDPKEWVFEFECDRGCSALFFKHNEAAGYAEGRADEEAITICRAWLLAMGEPKTE